MPGVMNHGNRNPTKNCETPPIEHTQNAACTIYLRVSNNCVLILVFVLTHALQFFQDRQMARRICDQSAGIIVQMDIKNEFVNFKKVNRDPES